jgi:hypothetical protein
LPLKSELSSSDIFSPFQARNTNAITRDVDSTVDLLELTRWVWPFCTKLNAFSIFSKGDILRRSSLVLIIPFLLAFLASSQVKKIRFKVFFGDEKKFLLPWDLHYRISWTQEAENWQNLANEQMRRHQKTLFSRKYLQNKLQKPMYPKTQPHKWL